MSANPNTNKMSTTSILIDNILYNINDPGDGHINWIKITKHKLYERETKLMLARTKILKDIVTKKCQIFENTFNRGNTDHKNNHNRQTQNVVIQLHDCDKIVPDSIPNECLQKMHLTLSLWNGLHLSKITKSLSTFRKYFGIAKRWFDKQKKNVLSPAFWIRIFTVLGAYTTAMANKYFRNKCSELFAKYLLFHIIIGLFDGVLEIEACKPQPLIMCGILKESDSMKAYLLRLDPSLNIDAYLKANTSLNAFDLPAFVQRKLLRLVKQSRDEFHIEFERVHSVQNVRSNNNNNALLNSSAATPVMSPPTHMIPVQMSEMNTFGGGNMYNGTHLGTQSIVGHRFNPMNVQISIPLSVSSVANYNLPMLYRNSLTPQNMNGIIVNGLNNTNNVQNVPYSDSCFIRDLLHLMSNMQ